MNPIDGQAGVMPQLETQLEIKKLRETIESTETSDIERKTAERRLELIVRSVSERGLER